MRAKIMNTEIMLLMNVNNVLKVLIIVVIVLLINMVRLRVMIHVLKRYVKINIIILTQMDTASKINAPILNN